MYFPAMKPFSVKIAAICGVLLTPPSMPARSS